MTLVLSFLSLVPRILIGFWVIQQVWRTVEERTLLIKIFSSAAVGFGVSSLAAFLWIWIGLPLREYAIIEMTVGCSVAFFMLLRSWQRWEQLRLDMAVFDENSIWLLLLAIGTVLFTIGSFLVIVEYPHGRMDAWMNWNVVARFIFLGGSDWKFTFVRQLDHPDYPLFMAVTNALTWTFLQKDSIWGPIAFHFLVGLFTSGLLFSLVYKFKGLQQACLVAVLFMSQPLSFGSSMSQLADFPLSYLILGSGGFLLLYLATPEKGAAILSGFFAGLAAWTKNEGLPFAFIISGIWLLVGLYMSRSAFWNYLAGFFLPMMVVLLFKLFLAPSNDIFSESKDIIGNLLDIKRYLQIFSWGGWALETLGGSSVSLAGLVLIYAFVAGSAKEKKPGHWMVVTLILAQLLVYFVIYLITPHDLEWHLKTSITRLFLHVFPLFILWLFIWLKTPQELASKES